MSLFDPFSIIAISLVARLYCIAHYFSLRLFLASFFLLSLVYVANQTQSQSVGWLCLGQ